MIKARNLSFTYPGCLKPAISDLDLDLKKGSFGLIESVGGSGKSTLIKLLMAMYRPSAGELEVNGQRLHGRTNVAGFRRSVGVVSETVGLIEDRTVSENIVLPLELADVPTKACQIRLVETLHRFGLDGVRHEFPNAISEGERRRTKIARALANEPFLLLLDDPTVGLDPATASALWDLLFREHNRGMTILAAVSSVPPEARFEGCIRVPFQKG